MKYSFFIGRYQPFHKGHQAIIDKVLKEGKNVLIGIRDTALSESNPYTTEKRIELIKKVYPAEVKEGRIKIITIPDIREVCYGRKVGWGIRKIRVDDQIEAISATKIRSSAKRVIWLTGNTGSGKTSLAYLLKERLNAIVLDGDEMRASISLGAGFSKEEREKHNLRVARLAKVLHTQGQNVVVSVIAPFASTRKKITRICDPYWIYIKGGNFGPDRPYEVPAHPDVTIKPSKESLLESLEKIIAEVGELD